MINLMKMLKTLFGQLSDNFGKFCQTFIREELE